MFWSVIPQRALRRFKMSVLFPNWHFKMVQAPVRETNWYTEWMKFIPAAPLFCFFISGFIGAALLVTVYSTIRFSDESVKAAFFFFFTTAKKTEGSCTHTKPTYQNCNVSTTNLLFWLFLSIVEHAPIIRFSHGKQMNPTHYPSDNLALLTYIKVGESVCGFF